MKDAKSKIKHQELLRLVSALNDNLNHRNILDYSPVSYFVLKELLVRIAKKLPEEKPIYNIKMKPAEVYALAEFKSYFDSLTQLLIYEVVEQIDRQL